MPEAFLEYIWYDEEVKEENPSKLPLTRYFPDLGLCVIRSSWERDAIHFSIKSSAPGGNMQWEKSWELDTSKGWRTRSLTHYHVDFNSFILMAYDSLLAIDEGFHRTSRAKVHNMITVDDTGCVGEKIWNQGTLEDPELFDLNCKGIYNVWRDVKREAVAEVEDFVSQASYTYYVANSNKLYYPEMNLTRNARHVFYSELGYFIMLDELKSDDPHTYTWRLHSEQFAEKMEASSVKDILDVRAIKGLGYFGLEIIKDNKTELFLYSEEGTIEYGDIKSDAKWISLVKEEGKLIKYGIYYGSYLVDGEHSIFKNEVKECVLWRD